MPEGDALGWRRELLRRYAWLLGLIGGLLLPFCFLGYGSDNDSYGVLDAGRLTWGQHLLATSRGPGYWTYEAMVYPLNRLGGSLLVNLVTLAVGLAVVWRVLVIQRRLGARYPALVVSLMVAAPVFATAATSTVDYLWSLLGLVVLAEALAEDRWGWATVAATFAYLIRVANGVEIAGMVVAGMAAEGMAHRRLTQRALRMAACAVIAACVGSLPLIASYRDAGNSFSFLHAMVGDAAMWTLRMRVGRFVVKGLQLFGVPASLLLLGSLFFWRRWCGLTLPEAGAAYRGCMLPLAAGGVAAGLLLFFKYPIEVSYLIPAETFLLFLLGVSLLAWKRWLTIAVLVATLTAGVVGVQLAEPNVPGHATSARLHLALRAGQIVTNVRQRLRVRHCATEDCWYAAR